VGGRTAASIAGALGGTTLAGAIRCRCKDMRVYVVVGGGAHYYMV
jgi:hypothetical protein